MEIKKVKAVSSALQWYIDGWKSFMANPVNWVLMALIFLLMFFLLGMIPLLGFIAVYLILPVLQAGMLYAAEKTSKGEEVDIADLFIAFKMQDKRNALIILGGIMLLAIFIVGILSVPVIGGGMLMSMDDVESSGVSIGLGGMLFGILCGVVLAMMFFYAPALIFLRNLSAIEAIKTSFSAAWKNITPFLLYLFIYGILAVIAAIPFGLGLLVLLPVAMAANYHSYRDIFG